MILIKKKPILFSRSNKFSHNQTEAMKGQILYWNIYFGSRKRNAFEMSDISTHLIQDKSDMYELRVCMLIKSRV